MQMVLQAEEETTEYHLELEYLDKVILVEIQKHQVAPPFLLVAVVAEDQQQLVVNQQQVMVVMEELGQQTQLLELHCIMPQVEGLEYVVAILLELEEVA